MQTPTGSRLASNNYIIGCHRWFELVGVSCSWSLSCSSRLWEPAPDRGLAALSDPRLSSPAEWERSAAMVRGTWGQYVAVCSRLQLTSHTQPFRNPFKNKVWEVYFSKEVCLFVIIVDYVSAYICIRIVLSQVYNIFFLSCIHSVTLDYDRQLYLLELQDAPIRNHNPADFASVRYLTSKPSSSQCK